MTLVRQAGGRSGGRAPPGQKSARQLEDFVGFAKFFDFTFKIFVAGALIRADAIAHVLVNFVLSNQVIEGLRHAANLGGNGLNGSPQGGVLASVFEHHADSAFHHLR
jgi:hypothetical protein